VALEDVRLQKIRDAGVVAVRRDDVDLVTRVGTPDVAVAASSAGSTTWSLIASNAIAASAIAPR
jgi:hypothetical protein